MVDIRVTQIDSRQKVVQALKQFLQCQHSDTLEPPPSTSGIGKAFQEVVWPLYVFTNPPPEKGPKARPTALQDP
jgi:hypothetical protein